MTDDTSTNDDGQQDEERVVVGQDRRLDGWGGNDDAPTLSNQQVARLQEREEPVAAANFGRSLTGDLGNAEVADESADAPETVEPDTSLGHEGGQRYARHEGREPQRGD
jgi:hypothetical protein